MKKGYLFILLVFCVKLYAQGLSSENLSFYTGKIYTTNLVIGNVELDLRNDNTYTAKYESEGMYWSSNGSWKLNGTVIELEPAVCFDNEGGNNCAKTLGKATAEIVLDYESLNYAEFIKLTSLDNPELLALGEKENTIRLGVAGKEVPEGAKRKYNGYEIIMMGNKMGTTTTGVKLRSLPSSKGDQIKYVAELYGGVENDFVPKGVRVKVIARTVEKDKMDKYENYWYLVDVGINSKVWMYGEFVKLN